MSLRDIAKGMCVSMARQSPFYILTEIATSSLMQFLSLALFPTPRNDLTLFAAVFLSAAVGGMMVTA